MPRKRSQWSDQCDAVKMSYSRIFILVGRYAAGSVISQRFFSLPGRASGLSSCFVFVLRRNAFVIMLNSLSHLNILDGSAGS